MAVNIYLDLETLPSENPAVREQLAAKIKPPATHKKAETIAKWEAEEKPALIDEAVAKTSFDGTYGRICVIGLAFNNANPLSMSAEANTEADMLKGLMAMVDERCDATSRPVFVGHNIAGFDLPFLWKRCIINRVRPSPWIPFGVKPWSDRIADTMLMWDDSRERRISLDVLCRVLGIATPKGELDGSKVAAAWAAGQYSEVAEYCRADVEAVRQAHRRLTFKEAA